MFLVDMVRPHGKQLLYDARIPRRKVKECNMPDRRSFLLAGSAAGLAAGVTPFAGRAFAAAAGTLAAKCRDDFLLGVAVANSTLGNGDRQARELIAREFTSLTGENCMKWSNIRRGSEWSFELADRLADLAESEQMYLVGHTLVWHSQIPAAVFSDASGAPLSRNALLDEMQNHIGTLVGRYRGRVHAWDVVNEAVDEGRGWRRTSWFNIIGDDYLERAFRMAAEADPGAHLIYNDYNMHNPGKREFLLALFRDFLERDVPIHGVGLQGHIGLDYPDLQEWERSIEAFADLGLKVHISELDIDVLPRPVRTGADLADRVDESAAEDPYRDGLPPAIDEALAERYLAVFRIFERYRDAVERVTFWGLHDGVSWKNNFPVRGRTNYPLLFDRELGPKTAYSRLLGA
jgi:endo-1,4-beta-xylanase